MKKESAKTKQTKLVVSYNTIILSETFRQCYCFVKLIEKLFMLYSVKLFQMLHNFKVLMLLWLDSLYLLRFNEQKHKIKPPKTLTCYKLSYIYTKLPQSRFKFHFLYYSKCNLIYALVSAATFTSFSEVTQI